MRFLKPVFIEMIKKDNSLQLKLMNHSDLPLKLILELANEVPQYFSLQGLAQIIFEHYNEFVQDEHKIKYEDLFCKYE